MATRVAYNAVRRRCKAVIMARIRFRRLPANTYHLMLNLTNRHIHAQLLDREAGRVILAAHSTEPAVRDKLNVPVVGPGRYATSTVAAAATIGELVAERASKQGISTVYWLRPGRYHGKIKAFVDAVRNGGVETHRPPPLEMPAAPTKVPVLTHPRHPPVLLPRKRCRRSHAIAAVTEVEPPPPPQATSDDRAAPTSLDALLELPHRRRYVFFGGKGGVGKTSSAAAVAVHAASAGLSTLVISTDPAHSLGDALRFDLSDGRMRRVDDTLPLYAVESDTREAVDRFRDLVGSLSARETAATAQTDGTAKDKDGGWASVAERLGLQEFSDVLDTIPPGADELIALVSVLDLVEAENADVEFDRIIIDTAPTGHTLRFLSFPDFLDRFLTQALALRRKLDGARGVVGSVTKMFMGSQKVDVNKALESAAERVTVYRDKMIHLSELFRDPSRTEFVVVTIATMLAVEESKRLIQRLWDEGIWVRHVIMNQILPAGRDDTIAKYLAQVRKGQAREISFATEQIADQYGLSITLVPRFDTEVRGVYGLQALARVGFREQRRASYAPLFDHAASSSSSLANADDDGTDTCQFVFVGGKGGVGKTSISSALGMALAAHGLKTLVLSTDPAHSLGDALQQRLDGGDMQRVDGADGELYALEIDSERAIQDFQTLARDYVAEGRRGVGVDVARKLGLEEFAGLLDNPPPGIDELVALTQVLELVKFGDFDRVVVDTAPTGHTLRLLSFPEFLDGFLGKVLRLKQRLDAGMDGLRAMLGRKDTGDAMDKAGRGVDRVRENMVELRALIADEQRTQFAIVTAPTGLAMVESERLVKSLKKDGVAVRNLVINQVVSDGSAGAFVQRIVAEQGKCMRELEKCCVDKNIVMVEVPYFDVEVRGVYGLKAMAVPMFSQSEG